MMMKNYNNYNDSNIINLLILLQMMLMILMTAMMLPLPLVLHGSCCSAERSTARDGPNVKTVASNFESDAAGSVSDETVSFTLH